MDSKGEMCGIVQDLQSQSLVEDVPCFVLGGGRRKFTSETAAKQQKSPSGKSPMDWGQQKSPAGKGPMDWGHPFCSQSHPLVPAFLCPTPPSHLFFIPFLPSPIICIKSFKGELSPSAYPRRTCNPPTSFPFEFSDPELVRVLSQYRQPEVMCE